MDRPARKEPGRREIPAAGFLAFAAVAAVAAAAHFSGITVCPLKRFTGFPCPACGATRAGLHALRGDIAGAFRLQPLVSTLLATAVLYCAASAAAWLLRRRMPSPRLPRSRVGKTVFFVSVAVLVAANWAYVIVNGN